MSPAKSIRLYYDGDYLGYVGTGQFNLRVDQNYAGTWGEGQEIVDMAASNNNMIGGFCADLVQSVPGDYTVYDVRMPEDAPIGGANSNLFPNGMGETKATHLRRLFDNELANAATSTTNAAAFQLAVWEIIYETGPDYELSYYDYGDRGTFYAKDGDSIALANEWLADVVAGSGDPLIRLRVLTDPCKQDYSVILPDKPYPASPAIPEPLTAAAMFAAVAGLGTYVRRRN